MKHYINLNEISVQRQFLEENRGKAGIYRWTNLVNGKTYIGSCSNLSSRFLKYFNSRSLRKNSMLINMAILKYKLGNFSLDILEYCTKKDVILREQYYLDTYTPKYNIFKIAGSSLGYKHNEDSLSKISSRKISEETLNNMRNRVQSTNTKIKISKAIGIPVKVIDINNEEVRIFISKKEAGKYLLTSDSTIGRYILSGKLLFNKYLITVNN